MNFGGTKTPSFYGQIRTIPRNCEDYSSFCWRKAVENPFSPIIPLDTDPELPTLPKAPSKGALSEDRYNQRSQLCIGQFQSRWRMLLYGTCFWRLHSWAL